VAIFEAIAAVARGWTGYTHQWRRPSAAPWRGLVQASVESDRDAHLARRRGWSTFHVLPVGQTPDPATECDNARDGTQCWSCLKCNGRNGHHVTIAAHGIGAQFVAPARQLPILQPLEVAA
jgi:hypothetical protein